MTSDHKTVRVVAYGKVQGVFFRDRCRGRARELGIRGWVRNRPDGTVEAVFAGSPDDVDTMVAWARTGPVHAEVTEMHVEEADDPDLTGFEVR